VDGERLVARCRELALLSEEDGRLTRPFGTAAMARARDLVGAWMAEAGLEVRVDAALNLLGRRPGTDPGAGTLLAGSHLDTVRDAGPFDGQLGVVTAVALAERLHARGARLPFALDVVGFSDEEGLRFGAPYLGSRALAGTFDDALLELVDGDGVRLADALGAAGGDPAGAVRGAAARAGERLRGYLEVHLEQGPVLEDAALPVGVVSAIAGATRAVVRFAGRPGHAGTVPMAARHDALCAASELVLAAERAGRATPALVATVGRMDVEPGAPNVVPGAAVASLDVRHPDDAVRRTAVDEVVTAARAAAAARAVEVEVDTLLDTPAVAMDPALSDALAFAVLSLNDVPVRRLPSGAGHDAAALAARMPVAMLFVRCVGGISHDPREEVAPADAEVALDVLERAVLSLAGGGP